MDAARALSRRCRTQMRRLITINGNATGEYITTVGAVAKATRLECYEVVNALENGWLVILGKDDGPMDDWTLEEDGE